MSLPSLDLEVLFATLIGQIPNDTPAEYQQCIRVVMSSFTDCATHQGPKRNHFTPKSEAAESRSKNSTVQGIAHCKVTYHYSLLKSFPSYVYVYKKSAPLLPPVMSKVPLLTNCNDEESLNNEKSSRDALPPTKRFKTMNERPYLYGLSPQTQALVNHSVFAEQDGSKGRKALFSSKVMSEQPPVSSKESHRRTIQ